MISQNATNDPQTTNSNPPPEQCYKRYKRENDLSAEQRLAIAQSIPTPASSAAPGSRTKQLTCSAPIGGMIRDGADTFWEVYDPGNAWLCPYNSHHVNSYGHAWSCTPAYFIRKRYQRR